MTRLDPPIKHGIVNVFAIDEDKRVVYINLYLNELHHSVIPPDIMEITQNLATKEVEYLHAEGYIEQGEWKSHSNIII